MSLLQLTCCRDFLSNHKLEKGKNFIGVFNKQYGFASQDFLVVRSNEHIIISRIRNANLYTS